MTEETISMKEKVDLLYGALEDGDLKTKKMRIPRKAKVRKRKMKKGWIGILKVDENGAGEFEKQQIIGNSYKLKDGTYHSLKGDEKIILKGKMPLVIQPSWKLNPINVIQGDNETYGQKYVMARMLSDTIKVKGSGGKTIIILLVIAALGYGAAKLFHWI